MPDVRVDDRLQLSRESRFGRASAPGKAILFGEHFVVHGAPALAVPLLKRRVTVTVTPASSGWQCEPRARGHLERMVAHLGVDPAAIGLAVISDLPIGSGLGSSAALAVALVRALEPEAGIDRVRGRAHALERLAHGDPSGVDDAVATYETAVWFRRGEAVERIEAPVAPLWIALTPPGDATHVAVAAVARFRAEQRVTYDALEATATACAKAGRQALVDGDHETLGACMNEAHAALAAVGVSTQTLDAVCEAGLRAGAWGAKLTGAGLGGACILVAPSSLDLAGPLREAGALEVFSA